ncbi:MAG TPA: hypothetical protein VK459_15735 [Polyangiaceae bacterium]|nr:hypothetical protein [Polyangiaceae bacterium]
MKRPAALGFKVALAGSRPFAVLVALGALFAFFAFGARCSKSEPSDAAPSEPSPGVCPVCEAPKVRGTLLSRALTETSGLAVSEVHADVVYAHNDSGDGPRFYAMTRTGGYLGAFEVTGAKAFDWEDMARGPCPSGSCLFLADTGDNQRQRSGYVIYRVPEPPSLLSEARSITPDPLPFVYPDGLHDAEALLLHPVTGVVTIVTKVRSGMASIFELPMPLKPGETVTLIAAGKVKPPRGISLITSGAVHPRAKGVLLRTYTNAFYYPMGPDQTVAQALTGPACEVPNADEQQGESIAWLKSGTGYMTVSEGLGSDIHVVECEPLPGWATAKGAP